MLANDQAAKVLDKNRKVLAAWLFGSQVNGSTRPDSDVDIALLVSAPLVLDDYLGLQDQLRVVFDKEIDLSVLNKASAFFRFEALSGVNIYSRDIEIQSGFVSRSSRDYEEAVVMWNRGLRYRKEAMNSQRSS